MSQTYDLLICGCGPTGATLANLLAAKGHRVAIFDRDTEIFHAPRAMMLDAESCRIFQSMGIMQKLEKQDSKPFYQHRFVNKNRRRLIDFDFIPDEVENMIIEEYKNNKPASRSNILPYFTKVKLRNLTGLVQEF